MRASVARGASPWRRALKCVLSGAMVRSTQVVRVSDSLPLAQSVDDDQDPELVQHKQQAKIVFRKISPSSETRCSIDGGSMTFQYVDVMC